MKLHKSFSYGNLANINFSSRDVINFLLVKLKWKIEGRLVYSDKRGKTFISLLTLNIGIILTFLTKQYVLQKKTYLFTYFTDDFNCCI